MLKDNEKYVAKGGFESDEDSEGQLVEAEDSDGNDSAEEFKRIKEQLKKAKMGGAAEDENDFEDEESSDDDYEF